MLRTSNLLNSALLAALASAGHGHLVVVADAGLPLPAGAVVVDLSVRPGLPAFVDVVRAVLAEGVFESCLVAAESADVTPFVELAGELDELPSTVVDHEEFKRRLHGAHVIVRTGECTPFANIGLVAGTTF